MKIWFAFAVLLLAFVAFPVSAPADNGAIVINDIVCGMLDGNGGGVSTTGSHEVQNHAGNAVLVCKASVTPSSTGHAVVFNNANTGQLCQTSDGTTADWRETVSADGQATLSCHVN